MIPVDESCLLREFLEAVIPSLDFTFIVSTMALKRKKSLIFRLFFGWDSCLTSFSGRTHESGSGKVRPYRLGAIVSLQEYLLLSPNHDDELFFPFCIPNSPDNPLGLLPYVGYLNAGSSVRCGSDLNGDLDWLFILHRTPEMVHIRAFSDLENLSNREKNVFGFAAHGWISVFMFLLDVIIKESLTFASAVL